MADAALALPLDTLLQLVKDSKTVVYATLASMALLIYDYFLTLDKEIDLVWKRRFSWGKVLFFVIRYFGILSHTFNTAVYINNTASYEFCVRATRFLTGSSVIVLFLVELTLGLRVWLLYNRSFAILAILGTFYIASLATVITMCVMTVQHQQVLVRPGPYLSGCYGAIPSYFFNVLIPPAINTSLLLILTAYKTLLTMKGAIGYNRPNLITLLLRDGVFYFVAVFTVLVINILVFHIAKQALLQVAAGFFVAIPCMVGSRMFLNVREKLLYPGFNHNRSTGALELDALDNVVAVDETGIVFAPSSSSAATDTKDPESSRVDSATTHSGTN